MPAKRKSKGDDQAKPAKSSKVAEQAKPAKSSKVAEQTMPAKSKVAEQALTAKPKYAEKPKSRQDVEVPAKRQQEKVSAVYSTLTTLTNFS